MCVDSRRVEDYLLFTLEVNERHHGVQLTILTQHAFDKVFPGNVLEIRYLAIYLNANDVVWALYVVLDIFEPIF